MISVVLYGRNDNYGYNLHKRAALSLNCIAEVLNEGDEILFVDYNTPDDFPTFPEAIQDTLTERAREFLRIFRVRPFIHDRFTSKTPLLALEPIARNVAVRRSRASNRWILSTNTDMIFILQRVGSLTDLVRDLPRGFYHAPRVELPEALWETLDRRKPREIIEKVRDWGWSLHLNEIVFGSDVILYDGPGDFQLFEREDLFDYHGFNEEMLLGWHVDSNIAKRMAIVYGTVGDLGKEVYGYHCDHTRQVTAAHSHIRTENDWRWFVDKVEAPAVPEQANTWGCVDDEIEEIHLRINPAQIYISALQEAVGAPQTEPRFAHYTGATYDNVDCDPRHLMPFLADVFVSSARNLNVGWYAAQTETLGLFAGMWQRLGFTGKILVDKSLIKKTDRPLLNLHFASSATILAEADVFVFDFGTTFRKTGGGRVVFANVDELRTIFAALVRLERQRKGAGKSLRRIISVNAINNRFESFVCERIAVAYSPFSGRMRQGFVLPPCVGEEDWLPLVKPGEAGIRDGQLIRSVQSKLGIMASGPGRYLEPGWYSLLLVIDAPSEHQEQWGGSPCVLISILSGALVLARHVLNVGDLNDTEHNFIFEVSQELADTFRGIATHFQILSPVSVALRKLRIAPAVPTDELKTIAATYSAFPLTPRTILDCTANGNATVYQAAGWAVAENIGTWTSGPRARLAVRLVGWPADDMILQLKAQPFLVRERHPALAVEVVANGTIVERWIYRYPQDSGLALRAARIPASLLTASPTLNIELQIDNPAVPVALGVHPTDDRQLGLCVSSVSFLTEQEELQRAGAVVTPGAFIELCANGRGASYQVDGWALPEDVGTWTNGCRASLRAKLEEWPPDDMIVEITARPFLVQDRHPWLAVDVTANGTVVDHWTYRHPDDSDWVVRSARIPASLVAASPILNIELQIKEPAVPTGMGVHPTDDRLLGLCVLSASFTPAHQLGIERAVQSWFSPMKRAARRTGTFIWALGRRVAHR